jgi:hypothetical protein
MIWGGAAVGAILVGAIVVGLVRRWVQREEKTETFTLQDLREMQADGRISAAEYKAMRATLLEGLDIGSPDDGGESKPGDDGGGEPG